MDSLVLFLEDSQIYLLWRTLGAINTQAEHMASQLAEIKRQADIQKPSRCGSG